MDVLANSLWVSTIKTLASPALLPVALAAFVSVTGPGGFAEFDDHMTSAPTIGAVPQARPRVSSQRVPALLIPLVNGDTVAATPPIEPDAPVISVIEEALAIQGVSEAPNAPAITPIVPPATNEPADPPPPQIGGEQPPVVPAAEEPPADPPAGADTTPPPAGQTGGADQPRCDAPGTGPQPHESVPPGQDQDGDGIDDRCQKDKKNQR